MNILPQRVLNEQPDKIAVQKEIISLLERVVILYQIPNWSEKNGIILSEWIMDNYKFETLETIKACLLNPPPTKDPNWRLTPDTINAWFEHELEKQAEKLENEHQKRKESELRIRGFIETTTNQPVTPETQKLIDEYMESIKNMQVKSVRPMTKEEIEREGDQNYDSYKQWKKDNGFYR